MKESDGEMLVPAEDKCNGRGEIDGPKYGVSSRTSVFCAVRDLGLLSPGTGHGTDKNLDPSLSLGMTNRILRL